MAFAKSSRQLATDLPFLHLQGELMGDRRLPLSAYLQKARLVAAPVRSLPAWAILSLAANVMLLAAIGFAVMRNSRLAITSPTFATTPATATAPVTPRPAASATPQLGPRQFYNYQQWVELLQNEATFAAQANPDQLTVLLGDSISQWFPPDQLFSERNWLNQGISGETTAGLLQRLSLLDETRPKTILLMIGINDLLRGVDDATLLANYRQIVRYLRKIHPDTQLVVQSILPHADAAATWEGRDRLLKLPNERIRQLNREIEAIAAEHTAYYLNLYPLFTDTSGDLRMELSTDGLHLNPRGYLVWRTALQMYLQGQG